jgi:hypothetical protein
MRQVEFDPTISVFERPKTVHALDCEANIIGSYCCMLVNSLFRYRPNFRSYKFLILIASLNNPQKVNSTLIVLTPDNGDWNNLWNIGHQLHIDMADRLKRLQYTAFCRREIFKSDIKIMNSLIFHRSWEAKSRLPNRAVIYIRSITW